MNASNGKSSLNGEARRNVLSFIRAPILRRDLCRVKRAALVTLVRRSGARIGPFTRTFWAQWQYIGIAALPVGWFLFSIGYSGYRQWLLRSRVVLLSVIPIAIVLLAFTNSFHGLLWAEIDLNTDGPFSIFDASYGPAWYLFLVYSYTLLMVGSIALMWSLRRFSTTYRWSRRIGNS